MKNKGLKDKTINELRAEAAKKGIPLLRSMKKRDILRTLEKGEKQRKASRSKASLPAAAMKEGSLTTAGAFGKEAVMKKAVTKTPLPAGKKKDPDRSPMKTATGRNSSSALPGEYGENDLFLIVVDPDVVYASWEIRREDLPGKRPALRMRLFDVTGTGPGGRPAGFIEIYIPKRTGSGFFEIRMHGRDVMAEIGCLKDGRFQPILMSNMVSFPVPMNYHESGMSGPPEPGTPVGY